MDIRASDEDRERTVDILREATGRGYLSLAEFEDRLGVALTARNLDQLDPLLADLPGTPRPTAGWTVPRATGSRPGAGVPAAAAYGPGPGGVAAFRGPHFLAGLHPVARVVLCVVLISMFASAVIHALSGVWIVALIVLFCVRRSHRRRVLV